MMINEEGDAYDPVYKRYYSIDPQIEAENFLPIPGEIVLFKRINVKNVDSKSTEELVFQGKHKRVRELQPVGGTEILTAHLYDISTEVGDLIIDELSKKIYIK